MFFSHGANLPSHPLSIVSPHSLSSFSLSSDEKRYEEWSLKQWNFIFHHLFLYFFFFPITTITIIILFFFTLHDCPNLFSFFKKSVDDAMFFYEGLFSPSIPVCVCVGVWVWVWGVCPRRPMVCPWMEKWAWFFVWMECCPLFHSKKIFSFFY